MRPLQGLHAAHCSPGLPAIAVIPGKTACRPVVNIGALMRDSYKHRYLQESKQSPTNLRRAYSRPTFRPSSYIRASEACVGHCAQSLLLCQSNADRIKAFTTENRAVLRHG